MIDHLSSLVRNVALWQPKKIIFTESVWEEGGQKEAKWWVTCKYTLRQWIPVLLLFTCVMYEEPEFWQQTAIVLPLFNSILSMFTVPQLWHHSSIIPVCIVARVLLHEAEGVPFPVKPVSQEWVEDMSF